MSCGGDDGSGPPPAEAPVVTSLDTTTVSPGDTLLIRGSHFATTASGNTVTFTNPTSATTPFAATSTQLKVVVDRDAIDGPVTVTTSGGSAKSSDNLSVSHGIGDVFVFGGTGANQVLRLPNPTATTRYLVVPHATNASVSYLAEFDYSIKTATAIPVAPKSEVANKSTSHAHVDANQWFEAQRWENAEKTYERFGAPAHPRDRRVPGTTAAAPAEIRQFYVLKTTAGNQDAPSSYQRVTAQLRYDGAKCLVYSDIDTLTGPLASGNFTQAHFNMFGQTYDNSIEATNVSYFGPYSDVDGNGRLIMLVTPVVNRLQEPACGQVDKCDCGFIAGFFNPRDLYGSPPVATGTTNHAEIIYLLAADPTGQWDCQFPVTETASENLGTIPHEHEHLTSFSWRIFHEYPTQVTWLEEGMAHMAEDLNGDNSSNIARGKLYRADPGAISLEDNTAPLEQRGGIYLMLRLLADRYGTGILKQILQSKATGRACIQNASGENFNDVLAEFLAAQYLSGKGITSDERYNYQSIDVDDFGPLMSSLHAAGGVDVTGDVRRSDGDFHVFTGLLGQESQFRFFDTTGQAKLRTVIVQIQ